MKTSVLEMLLDGSCCFRFFWVLLFWVNILHKIYFWFVVGLRWKANNFILCRYLVWFCICIRRKGLYAANTTDPIVFSSDDLTKIFELLNSTRFAVSYSTTLILKHKTYLYSIIIIEYRRDERRDGCLIRPSCCGPDEPAKITEMIPDNTGWIAPIQRDTSEILDLIRFESLWIANYHQTDPIFSDMLEMHPLFEQLKTQVESTKQDKGKFTHSFPNEK